MRTVACLFSFFFFFCAMAVTQDAAVDPSMPPAPHDKKIVLKHILVIGETKGFEHDSVSDAWRPFTTWGTRLDCGKQCCAPIPSSSPRRNFRKTPRILII